MSMKKTRVLRVAESKDATWEQTLNDFILWKKAESKSERTLKDYGYHIRNFFKCYPNASLSKPAYYNNKMVYLKTFFGWCVSEELLTENPLKDFKRRKADARIVQVDMEVIKKLLAMPNQSTFPGLRDYALILLQVDTGIRSKEALSLLVTDINTNALEVYVRAENAKTRVARTLPVSPITAKAIEKVISEADLLG
jgi:site-specific recombinase XerD